jgi:arylsulfatase
MACGAALALSPLALAGDKKLARPNVLVIVADDMGFSDAGCYGGEIETTNIDRLAANGIKFTQCYSTGRCWPSRTALLTGYYPQQVRMDPPKGPLPKWTRIVPHYLKPQGYRCYHSGKWHLRTAPKPIANGGFDRSYVIHDHDRFFSPKRHELDDKRLDPIPEGTDFYLTSKIADYSIDFLKQHAAKHRDKPFYSYLAFTSPHFPLHAIQTDIDRYRDRYLEGWDSIRQSRWRRMRKMGLLSCGLAPLEPDVKPSWNFSKDRLEKMIGPGEADRAVPWEDLTDEQKKFQATKMAIHAAMIDRMDKEIGRVIEQLKKMNALENTLILFVSDNGASAEIIIRGDMNDKNAAAGSAGSYLCLGPGFSSAANTPLRLHKSWVHEGGTSSPLIVQWPKGLAAQNELRHDPCHFVDILPTILDVTGAKGFSPEWNNETAPPLPGTSLVPTLKKDGVLKHDYIYFHHGQNRAIRVGDWKLVAKGGGPWELYNLKNDRCESKNLAEKYPDRVRKMSAKWQQCEDKFKQQAGAPKNTQRKKTK